MGVLRCDRKNVQESTCDARIEVGVLPYSGDAVRAGNPQSAAAQGFAVSTGSVRRRLCQHSCAVVRRAPCRGTALKVLTKSKI